MLVHRYIYRYCSDKMVFIWLQPYLTSCKVTEWKCWSFAFISARKFSKVIPGQINELIMRNS